MMNRVAAVFGAVASLLVLSSCGNNTALPFLAQSQDARSVSTISVRQHARITTTVMIEVPFPDPTKAKKAVVTIRQGTRTHTATVGLTPGGHLCRQAPAPAVGLRCSYSITLVHENFSYAIEIFDGQDKLRYTRSDTHPIEYATSLQFVVYDRFNYASVHFTDPTMGRPSRTPLDITPYFQDANLQVSGIVLWPGRLAQRIHIFDLDKTRATSLSRTTISTLADDRVDLLYDGTSYVNPWIGANRRRTQMFIPFLRTTEYVVPSHKPTMTNAQHGRMFVNSNGSITFLEKEGVGTIDARGNISEVHTPYEYDIAEGPDGHVWELAQGPGRSSEVLARINDDGSLAEYPLPDWVYGSMVLGSDGNFWMVSASGRYLNSARRLTPAGVITDFTVGGKDIGLSDLVAGGDGNLWFVGSQQGTGEKPPTGVVVKVATNGNYRSYILPLQNLTDPNLANPTWGPKGDLYTAIGYARLGRIGETGSYEELRGQLRMQKPGEYNGSPMAFGPDGAVWFSAMALDSNCALGRWTPHHIAFAQFATSCYGKGNVFNALPTAFVAGPNNTLWYTRDDRVGKISL